MTTSSLLQHIDQNGRICISFSGASSSGKSMIIDALSEFFTQNSLSIANRPSISRSCVKNKTEAERATPEFQFMMLERALEVENELFETSNADVFLFDRTTLDGYLYFQNYLESSQLPISEQQEHLNRYLPIASKMTQAYDVCYLLQRVVEVATTGIHVQNDLSFNDKFTQRFEDLLLSERLPIKKLPKLLGKDTLLQYILTHLSEDLVKKASVHGLA